jgi:hypothetical protein
MFYSVIAVSLFSDAEGEDPHSRVGSPRRGGEVVAAGT